MPKTRNAFAFRVVDYINELEERIKESREQGDIELAKELMEQADTLHFGLFEPKELKEPYQCDRIKSIEQGIENCERQIKRSRWLLNRFHVHIQKLGEIISKYDSNTEIHDRARDLRVKYCVIRKKLLDYMELMAELKKYNQETLRYAFNEEFGVRLRIARKKAGFTQDDVALRLGITKSSYSRYESGRREISPLMMYQLANLLNVSAEYLLGTESER